MLQIVKITDPRWIVLLIHFTHLKKRKTYTRSESLFINLLNVLLRILSDALWIALLLKCLMWNLPLKKKKLNPSEIQHQTKHTFVLTVYLNYNNNPGLTEISTGTILLQDTTLLLLRSDRRNTGLWLRNPSGADRGGREDETTLLPHKRNAESRCEIKHKMNSCCPTSCRSVKASL